MIAPCWRRIFPPSLNHQFTAPSLWQSNGYRYFLAFYTTMFYRFILFFFKYYRYIGKERLRILREQFKHLRESLLLTCNRAIGIKLARRPSVPCTYPFMLYWQVRPIDDLSLSVRACCLYKRTLKVIRCSSMLAKMTTC